MALTAEQQQLIDEEKIGVLGTVRRDGSPQLTPVNFAYEDGRFLFSTTRDRVKYHNVRRNANVSFCLAKAGWYPYFTVYGKATIEEQNIVEGTAAIMRKMGREVPPNLGEALAQQKRVLIILTPERFVP
jgi:PPOX class probable F420-dependent enzyme